jgi:hypothetical protein
VAGGGKLAAAGCGAVAAAAAVIAFAAVARALDPRDLRAVTPRRRARATGGS